LATGGSGWSRGEETHSVNFEGEGTGCFPLPRLWPEGEKKASHRTEKSVPPLAKEGGDAPARGGEKKKILLPLWRGKGVRNITRSGGGRGPLVLFVVSKLKTP